MTVSGQLKFSSFSGLAVLGVTIPLLIWSLVDLGKTRADELLVSNLRAKIYERIALRDEYLVTNGATPLRQWHETRDQIALLMRQARLQLTLPEEQALLDGMQPCFLATVELFEQVHLNRNQLKSGNVSLLHASELEVRLVSQLFIQADQLYAISLSLRDKVRDKADSNFRRAALLLVLLLVVLAAITITNSLLVYRVTSRGIRRLTDGTSALAAGDLARRLPVTGSDEFAQLSCHFNEMAERLQTSYVALEEEIVERKRAEADILRLNAELVEGTRQLESANRQMEVANKELEAFSYTVSHDLRAPLRHLSGFVDLLINRNSSGLDAKSRHYLEVIAGAARTMGILIDDLLAFARMGRTEMMNTPVNLDSMITALREELQPSLAGREISWDVDRLPMVTGDPELLKLVLANLIDNALKYTRNRPQARIAITADTAGDEVIFSVRDNGVGFDMKYQDKLFGLFQRLHHANEFEGTGVGLASVRRIIQRHGGRVWAEGAVGEGAAFYFTLPIREENGHELPGKTDPAGGGQP